MIIWRGSRYIPGGLNTGPHKYSGLDDAIFSCQLNRGLQPVYSQERTGDEEPHAAKGNPI